MSEEDVKVIQVRLPKDIYEKLEDIAASNTQPGEKVIMSLLYRDAFRQYIEAHEAM